LNGSADKRIGTRSQRNEEEHRLWTRSPPGDGTALGRDEWESEVGSDTPDFEAARGTALEPWLSKKVRRGHKLRIDAKKLRYAADFFSTVFTGIGATRRRGKFVDALKRLQDCLGDLNDIAVNEKFSARLAARANQGFNKSNGRTWRAFAAGRLSGREEARVAPVLKSAERAYQQFAEAKPYWS
jgi:CHAD domain-containing protein